MPSAINIVLNDAQATPVAHTFVPLGRKGNVVWFEDQSSATTPIGWNRISLEMVRQAPTGDSAASAGKRVLRIRVGIHTPKLEVLSNNSAGFTPAPTVAYTPRVNVEFVVSERAVLQDRKDLRKYAASLLAETQLTNMIESLINVW